MIGRNVAPGGGLLASFYARDGNGVAALRELTDSVRARVHGRLAQHGADREALEDLLAASMARLVVGAWHSREPHRPPIRDFAAYALKTADRVFSDYLRDLRPNWHHLRRLVLRLLDAQGDPRVFARWHLRMDRLGGLAGWEGQPFRATAAYQSFCEDQRPFCGAALAHRDPAGIPLPELLGRLFRELDTPLAVDELTGHLAALQGIRDLPETSLDQLAARGGCEAQALAGADPTAAAGILCSAAFRDQIWEQLCALPDPQRAALLLNMNPDELLIACGRRSRALRAAGLPPDQFADTWQRLPLPETAIAELVGVSVKQVSSLRTAARRRLGRQLTRPER